MDLTLVLAVVAYHTGRLELTTLSKESKTSILTMFERSADDITNQQVAYTEISRLSETLEIECDA